MASIVGKETQCQAVAYALNDSSIDTRGRGRDALGFCALKG
jgi:hypothetical protein